MAELDPDYTPPKRLPDFSYLRGRAPGGIRDAGVTRELWIAKEAYKMGHYEHFRQHRELFRRPETPTPTPEPKVGQVWRARNGQVVRIVSQADGVSYSLGGSNGLCYTSSGAYRKSLQQSEDDLIELISDAPVPPAEPAPDPTPKPELRVGQVWRTREGEEVTLKEFFRGDASKHPFTGSNDTTYTSEGFVWADKAKDEDDLVELISDAPTTTPPKPTPRPRLFAAPPVRTWSPEGVGMIDALATDGTAWYRHPLDQRWIQHPPLPPATDTP